MRDAKVIVELMKEDNVKEFSEDFPCKFSISHAIDLIKRSRSDGNEIIMGVEKEGELIGIIGLVDVRKGKGRLFFVIGDREEVNKDAVRIFLEKIRGRVDLVYAFIPTDDISSCMALEKNEFKRAGTIRRFLRNCFGEKLDVYVYFKLI